MDETHVKKKAANLESKCPNGDNPPQCQKHTAASQADNGVVQVSDTSLDIVESAKGQSSEAGTTNNPAAVREGHPAIGPEEWAKAINKAAGNSTGWRIKVGQLLLASKAALGRGNWLVMFHARWLRFGLRYAEMYMAVARNPAFRNSQYLSTLPSAITTLHILSQLPPEAIERGIANGDIHTNLKAAGARRFVQAQVSSPSDSNNSPPARFDLDREQARLLRYLRAQGERWPVCHHDELAKVLDSTAAELRAKNNKL